MDIYLALADPTRRNIIELLAHYGQLTASDIYEKFNVSASAISQHLKVLKETRLVFVEKKAQQRIYQLNIEKMLEFEEWAKKTRIVWDQRLDRLEKVLEEEKQKLNKS